MKPNCNECAHYHYRCVLDDLETCRFVSRKKRKVDILRITVAILLSLVAAAIILCSCGRQPSDITEPAYQSAMELLREQHRGELTEWQVLQLAIMLKESRFNPNAIGNANDRGVYQITVPYLNEANRLSGNGYSHDDAFDIEKSLEMFQIIQNKYNERHDIHEAIKHHNPGAGPAYERDILRNMETIRRYEEIRKLLIAHGK